MISNRNLKIFIAVILGCTSLSAARADIGSFFGKTADVVSVYRVKSNWQVVRAKFDRHGNASDSESYEDFWKLEILSDGQAFLETRRQRVPVKLDLAASAGPHQNAPIAVTLRRDDFALLTGVQAGMLNGDGRTSEDSIRLVFGGVKLSEPIVFESPADEHVAVRLALGSLENL